MKASTFLTSGAVIFCATSSATACADNESTNIAFNVSLSDDLTGENAIKPVQVNKGAVTLGSLFAGQAGDRIFATSLQAVNPGVGGGNVLCIIIDPLNPKTALRLNAQTTFVNLDGDEGAATQTDVTDFTVACEL
ncbi:hypothetical protein T440DRAFT_472771 [Plenodomus tracheiphilus IPT5]|uniref:Uncharacterized protein n=1 Tax=Plenodomus tracheiphilus IPT5 TaxID=1408161 RepID=A0A6A7AT41_9PLEO|nr:hypothetical protein T440DRAFT_472771 [Plenodomus tracheiphilus IPT5]